MTGWDVVRRHDPSAVERILRALPEWFGIEESLVEYVEHSATHPTYLALPVGGPTGSADVAGILVTTRHFPPSGEVHLMAVVPDAHRRGAGRALLAAAKTDLRADGVRFLQVKTLGPSSDDEHYARTREFYLACGFTPLEEHLDLWPGNPCLVLVKVL